MRDSLGAWISRLGGKRCLVTGSTGGIGLEAARLLVAEQARVVTCGRRHAPGIGEEAHVVADLSLAGEPERAVAETVAALGGLDVLVNCVGVARIARFEEVEDAEWDAYWQLDVMSYVRAIRAALPELRASRGAIVNVSSTAGKRPSTSMPHYSVMKAAVLSLSRLVADLYARDGIRCNAVTPGPTATDAWIGEGGLADQQGERRGGAREGRRRPSARPPRSTRRDRRGRRLPLLRPRVVRHRCGVERGRRHRPDHPLSTAAAPLGAKGLRGERGSIAPRRTRRSRPGSTSRTCRPDSP